MTNALVVADDLTGAIDTGHGFARRGRGARIVLSGPHAERSRSADADVLVIDTDSRDVDADTAAAAVRTALEASPPLAYKKVDSTLRGNVVPEVDAAIDAIDADLAVVAPAFPATGRTTRDGVHFVEGVPLADADYGVDESSLLERFADSRYDVAPLELEVVSAGSDAVEDALLDRLETAGSSVALCDAVEPAHLTAVADGSATTGAEILYVGSGGLAEHVAVPGTPRRPPTPERRGDGVLAVVGSVNDRTLSQLAAVPDRDVVRVDPSTAVRDPETAAREVAPALVDRIDERGRVVLTAATDESDVTRARDAAAALESEPSAGDRISRALARATGDAVTDADPAGLFLTGGDVARACLDELSVGEIELTGAAVAEGIPEGRLVDGRAPGTRVVTKAGGFGETGAIVNCLDRIHASNE